MDILFKYSANCVIIVLRNDNGSVCFVCDEELKRETSSCASHLEELLWCIILMKFAEMCDMDTDRQLR